MGLGAREVRDPPQPAGPRGEQGEVAAAAGAAGGGHRVVLVPGRPFAAADEGAVPAAPGRGVLQLLWRVREVVAAGEPRAVHGVAPEHEVQVVALPRLQVPPPVLGLVGGVQLVHHHVDGVVLEEPRHGDGGPDLEVPAQQVDDLRDAPEAQRVGVLGVDVLADALDGLGVSRQAHRLPLQVEAAPLDAAELAAQGRWGRTLRGDDDLVPRRHVRD
mmetsp:Transcript_58747/g.184412  ORF Transcript_58747/g.184412 Transcript_58747/m.184412 type:complete len:216 (-) Transcript_58747:764-1411(-)